MWKFQDFCITQILREINLEDSRSAKTAFLAILRANNFVHLVNFSLKKVKKTHKPSKLRASKCVKMADFALLEVPKMISRKI